MVQYSVDTSAVGYTAASMSAALAQFDAQVAAVNAAITGIVGSSWTGDAADAFGTAWASWQQSAAFTRLGLAGIVADLHVAQGAYDTVEQQNQAAAQNLGGGV